MILTVCRVARHAFADTNRMEREMRPVAPEDDDANLQRALFLLRSSLLSLVKQQEELMAYCRVQRQVVEDLHGQAVAEAIRGINAAGRGEVAICSPAS